jgi:hypothetical protein
MPRVHDFFHQHGASPADQDPANRFMRQVQLPDSRIGHVLQEMRLSAAVENREPGQV